MRTPTWCRQRAEQTGPAIAEVIAELLDGQAPHRLHSAQAILALAGKYSDARLEAACRKAATAGDPSYRTIRNILAAGLEDVEHDRPTGDAGTPAFLHGPAGLFAANHPRGLRLLRQPQAPGRPDPRPAQADDLYELISQRVAEGRSTAITANRAPQDWYPLFPNPVVAESLLDRLINTSHQVFMNGPPTDRTSDPKHRPPPSN